MDHTNDNFKNNFTFANKSSLSTILIFGEIIDQLEVRIKKNYKKHRNHYCEMTKFDDKIIIRLFSK